MDHIKHKLAVMILLCVALALTINLISDIGNDDFGNQITITKILIILLIVSVIFRMIRPKNREFILGAQFGCLYLILEVNYFSRSLTYSLLHGITILSITVFGFGFLASVFIKSNIKKVILGASSVYLMFWMVYWGAVYLLFGAY